MDHGRVSLEQLSRRLQEIEAQQRRLVDLVAAQARVRQLQDELAGIAHGGVALTGPRAFRPKQAAEYVGLPFSTFRGYVKRGLIADGVSDGGSGTLHLRKHLDAYLRRLEKPQAG